MDLNNLHSLRDVIHAMGDLMENKLGLKMYIFEEFGFMPKDYTVVNSLNSTTEYWINLKSNRKCEAFSKVVKGKVVSFNGSQELNSEKL